jgi:hypothetical protein
MPERHAAEHQDDDREDDENVEQEVWNEGIQCNESMEYRVLSMGDTEELEGWTKGSAKVQIGAELLCKSAKLNLGVGVGTGVGAGKPFRCLEVGT